MARYREKVGIPANTAVKVVSEWYAGIAPTDLCVNCGCPAAEHIVALKRGFIKLRRCWHCLACPSFQPTVRDAGCVPGVGTFVAFLALFLAGLLLTIICYSFTLAWHGPSTPTPTGTTTTTEVTP